MDPRQSAVAINLYSGHARYLPYVSGGSATLNPATEVLTVSEVGKIYTQQLSGNYTGDSFDLAPDGNGGTDITLSAIATDIFVTNFGTDTVGEYTTSGARVNASLISGLSEPQGIAVAGSDLFVTSFDNGTVREYTIAGATVNASLISGFSFPEGIAVSGSDLFVANANATSEGSLGPGWIGEYTTSGATVDAKLISGLDSPSYIAIANAADPTEHPSNDFNGDGFSDLLWQNSSGVPGIWEMNGADVIGAASVANPGRAGTSKAPGILTVTAKPTSCGRTAAARRQSG